MAGWEPERMKELKELFTRYKSVSHEDLFAHLEYFLKAVIPVCEEYGVTMAIHPDDPPGISSACPVSIPAGRTCAAS